MGVDMNRNTKQRIFEEATRLFSEKSYDTTTTREIAAAADIKGAGIYRHFESKEAILNAIMAEFRRKLKRYLLTPKQVAEYIKTDTPRQLLSRCVVNFRDEEQLFMLRAYRIISMEQLTNETAKDIIIGQLHQDTAICIQSVLEKLMECGLIPEFDAHFFAKLWSQSLYSESMIWMQRFSDGQEALEPSMEVYAFSENLIQMALNGSVPAKG